MKLESWRLFFPLSAALGVGALGAWAAQLLGAPLGLLPVDHGALMVHGVLGTGVFGFAMTAYPKQNDAPLPTPAMLWTFAGLQAAAMVGWLAGVPILPVLPWLLATVWAARIAVPSLRKKWDDTTAAVPVALFAGVVSAALAAFDPFRAVDIAAGPFLPFLALAILDRVLPFFSSRVTPGYTGVRRRWFLGPLGAVLWARALHPHWIFDLAALILLLRQAYGWAPWPASRTPMIGIVHLGVAWLAAAWALDLAGAPRSAVLHATLLGGVGTLLFALSMRVVRGHGGLPLVLGRAGAAIIALVSVAALLRVALGATGGTTPLLVTAAGLLAAAFGAWLGRFARTCVG